jgi:hypothetical protein
LECKSLLKGKELCSQSREIINNVHNIMKKISCKIGKEITLKYKDFIPIEIEVGTAATYGVSRMQCKLHIKREQKNIRGEENPECRSYISMILLCEGLFMNCTPLKNSCLLLKSYEKKNVV